MTPVETMREAAAQMFDDKIKQLEAQIEANNEYTTRRDGVDAIWCEYNRLCRDEIRKAQEAAEEIRALSRHGLAIVPAESAGAARDMREAAAKIAYKHGWRASAGDRVSSYGEGAFDVADAIASKIRALPLPTALPDGRDEAMRSAAEIRAEIDALRDETQWRSDEHMRERLSNARMLEWVLSPSKPQEPTR